MATDSAATQAAAAQASPQQSPQASAKTAGGKGGWRRKWLPVAVNVCRVALALTFLFSGWVKANDPIGTAFKLEEYLTAAGLSSLAGGPLPLLLALAVSTLEFMLGVALLLGLNRLLTAAATLALMAAMTGLTVWIWLANPVSDCGCFGDALILSNGMTLLKNVVLLAMALVLMRWSRLQPKWIPTQASWLVSLPALVGIVAYAVWCIHSLPRVDFRPYFEGENLSEARMNALRQMASGEAETERPAVATYQWHRKDVADFFAIDCATGNELTDELLDCENPVLLLTLPDARRADQGCAGSVNQLYDLATEEGWPFYCLTSADSAQRAQWEEYTGAEYPFAEADELTLRTMVRANPGLMLLQKGRIVRKWSNWNMPSEEELKQCLIQQ